MDKELKVTEAKYRSGGQREDFNIEQIARVEALGIPLRLIQETISYNYYNYVRTILYLL